MFKKIILSAVAVATLSTGAFANGFEDLAKASNLGEYMAIPDGGGKCVNTKNHLASAFNENFTSTSQAISFMGKASGRTDCYAKVQGSTVIIGSPTTTFYFFDTAEHCEEKLRQLKGGN